MDRDAARRGVQYVRPSKWRGTSRAFDIGRPTAYGREGSHAAEPIRVADTKRDVLTRPMASAVIKAAPLNGVGTRMRRTGRAPPLWARANARSDQRGGDPISGLGV